MIENTVGWQRGGQAKPLICPTFGAQAVTADVAVTCARCARETPFTAVNSPPISTLPLGVSASERTEALVSARQLAMPPLSGPTAAAFAWATPPTFVKSPPR